MGWEAVYVLVVHPEQLLKLAKQQQYHNTSNCSRQSNSTVPNQTTPFHTILQTAVSRGSRIRLLQIRLHHTTQFSKPLSAEAVEFDCSKSDYTIPQNSPNRCQPRQSNSTVPNQTTPYHTILQTAVSRGMRPLSLHKKRFA